MRQKRSKGILNGKKEYGEANNDVGCGCQQGITLCYGFV